MCAARARASNHGFTLVEVLVALGIVAIALMAGLQATAALTRQAERQAGMVLAQPVPKTSWPGCGWHANSASVTAPWLVNKLGTL